MIKQKIYIGISMLCVITLLLTGCKVNYNRKESGQGVKEPEDSKQQVLQQGKQPQSTPSTEISSEENITNEESETAMNSGIEWAEKDILAYKPKEGGVWYPRIYRLKNNRILCGFDTNEDGNRSVIKLITSDDGGLTWSRTAVQVTDYPEYDCANANFIELENGGIWAAYRANIMKEDIYYSSIRVSVSKDGGKTWERHSTVAKEQGEGGLYEPQFGYIGNSIAVFYANDSLNVVRNNRQQNIEFKLWKEDSWGNKIIASDGTKTFSRDGMPVWCQLEDGSYAMVIESTALSPTYPFIIQMKISPDGYDWSSDLKNIYVPGKFEKKAGAPYIVKLKDGRIAVSFQTDEDAAQTGDDYSKMKVMVSTDVEGSEFLPCSIPFDTPDGYCSNWNSLLSYDDYLIAATSTNYPTGGILIKRGFVK